MDTLIVWMLIGLDIYLGYGVKKSKLGNGTTYRKGMRAARYTGIVIAGLLIIAGFLNQYVVGFDSGRILLYISVIFGIIHIGLLASKLSRSEPINENENVHLNTNNYEIK